MKIKENNGVITYIEKLSEWDKPYPLLSALQIEEFPKDGQIIRGLDYIVNTEFIMGFTEFGDPLYYSESLEYSTILLLTEEKVKIYTADIMWGSEEGMYQGNGQTLSRYNFKGNLEDNELVCLLLDIIDGKFLPDK